jgi:probable O-glycosylation ligase (exosortase A-associated)
MATSRPAGVIAARAPLSSGALVPLVGGLGIALGLVILLVGPLWIGAAALGLAVVAIILRSPYIGLLGYLAIEYIRPGEMFPTLGAAHIQRLAGLVLLVSVAVLQVIRELRRRRGIGVATAPPLISTDGQSLALLALLGVMFASVATAHWKSMSLASAIEFGKTVLAYLLILYLVRGQRQARHLLWLFVAIVGWHAVWAVHGYLAGSSVTFAQNMYRATGPNNLLGEPNALASLLASATPVMAYLALAERSRLLKVVAVSLMVIAVWGVIFTASRAGVVALAGVALYVVLNSRRRILVLGMLAVGAALVWLAMPQDNRDRILSIARYEQDASALGRLEAWAAARRMFAERPLLGVGIGGFMAAHGDLYSRASAPSYLDSHSLFYQVIAEIGLLGLIAFTTFIVLVVRNQMRARRLLSRLSARRSHAYLMLVALGASLLSLLIAGISGHNLFRFTYYLIAALTLVYLREAQDTAAASPVTAVESEPEPWAALRS